MILLIDNYDSFTYNLVQMLEQMDQEVKVFRNDRIDIQDIEACNPSALMVSPGPGTPTGSTGLVTGTMNPPEPPDAAAAPAAIAAAAGERRSGIGTAAPLRAGSEGGTGTVSG